MTVHHPTGSWRKSSYTNQETNCVEVSWTPASTRVRDTKKRDQGHLEVPATAFRALIERL